MNVTIAICYQAGTSKILDACLSSIRRHTPEPHQVVVLTRYPDDELYRLFEKFGFIFRSTHVDVKSHNVHGAMLDDFVCNQLDAKSGHTIINETEYLLTLDSDCFPVADGWLTDLVGMIENGARIAGILHPWAPPPGTLQPTKVEWRIRSQHCWESTHVACQLIRFADLKELGKKFNEGDDTGLAITIEARKRGWKIDGFKPTRCPRFLPETDSDPEFNRYSCVVFGDKVYHHGGYTRSMAGDRRPYGNLVGWVTDLVLDREGAEFLLIDDQSYPYKFDREEEVAAEKIGRLFGHDGRNLSSKS